MTTTERNWIAAVGLALLTSAGLAAWGAVERATPLGAGAVSLVRPLKLMTPLFLGVSHFTVATLFLVTSRRNPSAFTWARSLAFAALFCAVFVATRRVAPTIASAFVLLCFVVHDMRDQLFFYRANGDLNPAADRPGLDAALLRIPFFIVFALAIPLGLLYATSRITWTRGSEDNVTWFLVGHRWPTVAVVALVAIALGADSRRRLKAAGVGAGDLWRNYRPAVMVLTGILLLFATAARLGSASWVIGVHVTAWYVFTVVQLTRRRTAAARAPSAGTWSWAWLRGTPAGFQVLHVGIFFLVVATAAVWTYGLHQSPGSPLAWIVSRETFPLWTIGHLTVSFSTR